MKYLYHRVPANMIGDTLYPLSGLKNVYPNVFAERLKRYEGRERIMNNKIPGLNCLWNDVLHLAAVDPREIKKELDKVGKETTIKKFYKIDPNSLDPKNTTVYLYRNPKPNDVLVEEDFIPYSLEIIKEISAMPEETKEYYTKAMSSGEKVFIWHQIPHILYKGTIDVSNLEILEI